MSSSTHPATLSHQSSSVLDRPLKDVSEEYELMETIGHGTFGVVRKARHRKSGAMHAVKTILKHKVPSLDILKKEVDILSQVDHPHIIKLYDAFEEETKLHLVTELCTGGELYDRVVEKSLSEEHHFSEYDVARILRNILEAIAYCHDVQHICHRDLKVENFLLLDGSDDAPVKIIDFGLSRFNPDNVMTSRVGTVYYVAPEVLLQEDYTNKCDIWSIGVIAYVLLCGFPPFYASNERDTLTLVKAAEVDFPSPIWDDVSSEAKGFIQTLLQKSPDNRPTAQEALEISWLHHAHVQPHGVARKATFVSPAKRSPADTNKGRGGDHQHSHTSMTQATRMRQSHRRKIFQRFLGLVKRRKQTKDEDSETESNIP